MIWWRILRLKKIKEIIENNLKTALSEMQRYLQSHGIDTKGSDKFRVVMVGGFSNFYLVRHMIKNFFIMINWRNY